MTRTLCSFTVQLPGFTSRSRHAIAFTLLMACLASASPLTQSDEYVIGAEDVLAITVFDHTELSGKFTVESDGTFTFPLVGRVKAGGLTLRLFDAELRRRLEDGFFKNPQLTVGIEQYRSQQIFVVGEVQKAGTYPISTRITLIEALARAGSTTPSAGGEAVIVRPVPGEGPARPVLPNQDGTATVLRVNLKELQSGALSDVELRDGDTLFVPRAEVAYVFGQVNSPGAYPVTSATSVLQALSLAGGITERGTTNRVKIIRLVGGQKREIKAKLSDLVHPGDTIMVAERFF